ncbi:MAG: cytochrome b/b6 domain-containing protein [Xanthomonadales bacterium]|jgi:cytochrome b561|nr:cytochrome b/b6 domain-containing protein [Xanthomonadales bacterium]
MSERYPPLQRGLHWCMALTLPVQGLLGGLAERVDDPALGRALIAAHLQLGLLLLLLIALRIGVRVRQPPPALLTPDPLWQRRMAASVHAALYLLLVLLPLSGLLLWVWMRTPLDILGLLQIPALMSVRPTDETTLVIAWYLHVWGAWGLLGLLSLHVGAALWHQGILRDRRISRRM